MAQVGAPYASGRWLVNPGSEDEFVERWATFTQWSLDNIPKARSYVLLRDDAEARRFVSLGAFENQEAEAVAREPRVYRVAQRVHTAVRGVRAPRIHGGG